MDFTPFPKIPRWRRELCVTEKIDGTNASIGIREIAIDAPTQAPPPFLVARVGRFELFAGARKSWRTPGRGDNYGFAGWVADHADELVSLGTGLHFGEWWGPGIQRGYGVADRRFSLFNVKRWGPHNPNTPACVSVVPVLYRGNDLQRVEAAFEDLRRDGSRAAPGWMNPEGVVIFHAAAGQSFKRTLDNDDQPKSVVDVDTSPKAASA